MNEDHVIERMKYIMNRRLVELCNFKTSRIFGNIKLLNETFLAPSSCEFVFKGDLLGTLISVNDARGNDTLLISDKGIA